MLAPYSASHNANAAGMASSAYGPPVSHTPDGTARALEAQTKAYRNRYAEPIGGDDYPNADSTRISELTLASALCAWRHAFSLE